MANIICTTTEARTSLVWVGLCCLHSLSRSGRKWKRHAYIYLDEECARRAASFNILHGRIKFYLPPHGKVRDENSKVREATKASEIV
ncbi:hypothetical protein AVEN_119090-1 [Araneus ventricosus]|uniref:Uncharacterized protein n=1 Tax=Araneus ventricosus TaxID=182803 RepID=A0A4Y2BNC8_ARAVE|nr:hypothetical protein AVEN_119090-1 [Araneus ventricosus]